MIVTTGGQQVIDLVCKTLIDPGDVIVAEAPTYPGAIPSFSAYQADVVQIEIDADGMPIDALEETLDELAREGRQPKFIYTIPNFQNPGGVTMSLAAAPAAGRGRARARAARARGQPLRDAALRGRAAADPLLAGRGRRRTRQRLRSRDLPRTGKDVKLFPIEARSSIIYLPMDNAFYSLGWRLGVPDRQAFGVDRRFHTGGSGT